MLWSSVNILEKALQSGVVALCLTLDLRSALAMIAFRMQETRELALLLSVFLTQPVRLYSAARFWVKYLKQSRQ